jgi:hypothetical protein
LGRRRAGFGVGGRCRRYGRFRCRLLLSGGLRPGEISGSRDLCHDF